jgi:hypothetical protein
MSANIENHQAAHVAGIHRQLLFIPRNARRDRTENKQYKWKKYNGES